MNINDNTKEIPLSDFYNAYYKCRKNKRRTINALLFELNYESNLLELWELVNNRTYKIGKSICFCVTRPKLREVFAADFRDRIIHHVVISKLEPLFELVFIEDNYNCRVGKGTLYGVFKLYQKAMDITNNYTTDAWVGKFDMSGFFMSINKQILWDKLDTFIRAYYTNNDIDLLLWLVNMIVMNNPLHNCIIKGSKHFWNILPKNKSLFTCGDQYGLPIGNLTSQVFANFYLYLFDLYMCDKYKHYGRYVDDFYVLATNKNVIINAHKISQDWLYSNLLIKLNKNKIYILPLYHGVKFIGGVVKKDRIYISNNTVSNFILKILKFNVHVFKNNIQRFAQVMNSYLGFLIHYKTYNIRYKILNTIDTKWLLYAFVNNLYTIVKVYDEHKIKY